MSWLAGLPILSFLVWTPAAGAIVSGVVREDLRRKLSIAFAALALALASILALASDSGADVRELRRWIPELGLSYDLSLDPFRALLALWVAFVGVLGLVESREPGRRASCLLLLAETALLGIVTAGDGVLFLGFYGAGLIVLTLFFGRADEMKAFFFFQSAGAAGALATVAISYHLLWLQTGFPSAEMARFSSLVTYPDFHSRMFLLGACGVAFAAPLFPFTSWISGGASGLAAPGRRLVLLGGWSLAGTLFFVRAVLPAHGRPESARWAIALAALSTLYAGLSARRSWIPLLVGFQGVAVLGLLSSSEQAVAAGRAAMLHLALALSAMALWKPYSDDLRGPALTSAIPISMLLPASWVVLREQWSASPALTALTCLGLLLMAARLVKALPPLSRRRSLALLPILAIWIFSLLKPNRFAPPHAKLPVALEEE
jgi:NADH:ubiquinone oxidoreductase subunit 4 (subunit M)